MAYAKAAHNAVAYLTERLFDDDWVSKHDDVAYFFKAPLAIFEADKPELCAKAFDIALRYLDDGGAKSSIQAYSSEYPYAPWMWMCWEATCLEREDVAKKCFEKLFRYIRISTGAGVIKEPYIEGEPFVGDFFATAIMVKAAMLVGRTEVAETAADKLVDVLEGNAKHMENGRFYLKWTGQKLAHESAEGFGAAKDVFLEEDDSSHCIQQKAPEQLYFMMGFPAMVLIQLSALVSSSGEAEAYKSSALQILDYLKNCEGLYTSLWAHEVGIAAAMAGDSGTAIKIADFLVSLQQSSGSFFNEPESAHSFSETAEIATWLFQIQRLIA